jgi:tRNA (guanosine-2'-O-)-methyltransferase
MTPERFAKLRAALERRQPDLTVLADSVNKDRNVSAIVRTADAVGIHRLHAVSDTGLVRKYHNIAGGAKRFVDIEAHPSIEQAIATLRAEGWRLVAAHGCDGARDFREVDYTQKVAVMVGAELIGLSPVAIEAADEVVEIPMLGLGTSLNVSVATGIILAEAARQRRQAGLYDVCRLPEEEVERTLFEWAYPHIARRCRQLKRPYPKLTEDGYLTSNPLTGIEPRRRTAATPSR